jgi:hypothetical protein
MCAFYQLVLDCVDECLVLEVGEMNRRVGVALFAVGGVLMAVGSLLPWFMYPLYIRYGWTKSFVEHVWPQTMVGNTPLIVLVWIIALPVGVILAILGGLIYGRSAKEGA